MFIEAVARRARPPAGGPCLHNASLVFDDYYGLLAEGAELLTESPLVPSSDYKHNPPKRRVNVQTRAPTFPVAGLRRPRRDPVVVGRS